MRVYINLRDERSREIAIRAVNQAEIGHCVIIHEPTRSIQQNSKLHALLHSLDGKEWAGKSRSMEEWKVLLVSAHAIATGLPNEVITGLEGEMVNIRESTAQMSVSRLSSLIEYIQAWIDDQSEKAS